MSWTDIAKALAPSGAGILAGLAINKGIANRRAAAQQAVQQAAQQTAQQNAQGAAAQTRLYNATLRDRNAISMPPQRANLRHAMTVTSASPSGRQTIRPGQVMYLRRDDL